jgi:hypothetical protein
MCIFFSFGFARNTEGSEFLQIQEKLAERLLRSPKVVAFHLR